MNDDKPSTSTTPQAFHTTRWTMVINAQGNAPEARAALGDLCEAYWTPVHRFLQREGRNEDQSRELAQAFFAELLAKGGIDKAERGKGRFRSYLLGALKHFLSNRRRAERSQKRGGEAVIESLDSGGTDTSPGRPLPDPGATPTDAYFDRHWALAVMERGLTTVQVALEKNDKGEQFTVLKPWLVGDTDGLSQTEAAAELGLSAGAVKVAIHRLRQQFGEAVRAEIAETVDTEEEVRSELRYLIDALQAG